MRFENSIWLNWARALVVAVMLIAPITASAQDNPLAPGWLLDSESSVLRFQSIKNSTKVESSTFATYIGTIDQNGLATIRIGLDSVDTNVDLRNVRMRFLLFETFQFPEATINMQITPEMLENLTEVRHKIVTAPYAISLHGVTAQREAEVALTLLDNDTVLVTSGTPISVPAADYALADGIQKLEEAAKVVIIPSATVSFEFLFHRAQSAEYFTAAATEMAAIAGLGVDALEAAGDFSVEACEGRFEIMSRADNIYFPAGTSRLEDRSAAFLDSIVEIVNRCPDLTIRIAGHTDSDGSADINQSLSEARASSVLIYLIDAGVDERRMRSVGLGETEPVAPNDTDENKQRNRRIEFSVIGEL